MWNTGTLFHEARMIGIMRRKGLLSSINCVSAENIWGRLGEGGTPHLVVRFIHLRLGFPTLCTSTSGDLIKNVQNQQVEPFLPSTSGFHLIPFYLFSTSTLGIQTLCTSTGGDLIKNPYRIDSQKFYYIIITHFDNNGYPVASFLLVQ